MPVMRTATSSAVPSGNGAATSPSGVAALVGSWIPTSGFLLVLELAFLGLLYVALLFPAGELEKADLRRVLPW